MVAINEWNKGSGRGGVYVQRWSPRELEVLDFMLLKMSLGKVISVNKLYLAVGVYLPSVFWRTLITHDRYLQNLGHSWE